MAINCAAYPAVSVSFESYWRHFNDMVYIEASNDSTNYCSLRQLLLNLHLNIPILWHILLKMLV